MLSRSNVVQESIVKAFNWSGLFGWGWYSGSELVQISVTCRTHSELGLHGWLSDLGTLSSQSCLCLCVCVFHASQTLEHWALRVVVSVCFMPLRPWNTEFPELYVCVYALLARKRGVSVFTNRKLEIISVGNWNWFLSCQEVSGNSES